MTWSSVRYREPVASPRPNGEVRGTRARQRGGVRGRPDAPLEPFPGASRSVRRLELPQIAAITHDAALIARNGPARLPSRKMGTESLPDEDLAADVPKVST